MSARISTVWLTSLGVLIVVLAFLFGNCVLKSPKQSDTGTDAAQRPVVADRKPFQVRQETSAPVPLKKEPSSRLDKMSAYIAFNGDKVSVRASNTPLKSILSAIASKTGIKIAADLQSAEQPVSIELQDVPLLEGLQRLIVNYDSLFLFEADKQSFSGLNAIWIYPKGHGVELVSAHNKRLASENKLSQGITDVNADNRAFAYEQLIMRNPPDVMDIVMKSLADSDGQVRLRTLNMAITKGVSLPLNLLNDLINGDSYPEVRAFALTAITVDPDIDEEQLLAIAESASHDGDPLVEAKALEILDQLEFKRSIETSNHRNP